MHTKDDKDVGAKEANPLISCGKCGKTFTRQFGLNRHYERTRHGERMYPCQHCPEVFNNAKQLRSHHTIHSKCEESHACHKSKIPSLRSQTQEAPTMLTPTTGKSLAGVGTSSLISNLHQNSSNADPHPITFHGHDGSGAASLAAVDGADSSFLTDKKSKRIGEHQCYKCGWMYYGDHSGYLCHLHVHGEPATPCTKLDCLDLFADVHSMRVHHSCHEGYVSCTFPDCQEGFPSAHQLIKHAKSHNFNFVQQEQQEFREIKRGISPTADPQGNFVVMQSRVDTAVRSY